MAELELTLACWDYDRVMAIVDGRVGIEGCGVRAEVKTTAELFPLAVGEARYDLSLIHISSPRDQRGSRMPSSA